MKASSAYVFRIVATSAAGACTSAAYTVTTGALAIAAPKPAATIYVEFRESLYGPPPY